jgi:hypothetical protein
MNPTLKENPSTLLRVVVVVAAVAVLSSAVSCGFRKKPSRVVDLIRTTERGEIDQAAAFMSQGFVSRQGIDTIKESFREAAHWIKNDGGVKAIKVLKDDSVGDIAEVTVQVTRGGGDSSVVYYKLIWEKGDWKIDGVASGSTLPAPSVTP